MSSKITARILPGTERAATWLRIFGGDTVPLKSSIPSVEHLPGVGFAPVLFADIEALSQEQLNQLAHHLAVKFGEPLDAVCADLASRGLPILADDLVVAVLQDAGQVTHARGLPFEGAPPTICGTPGAVPIVCGQVTCEACVNILSSVELLDQAARQAGVAAPSDPGATAP